MRCRHGGRSRGKPSSTERQNVCCWLVWLVVVKSTMKATGPVSVVLPARLRARVGAEARRRGLKLSPAIRALVAERLGELEESEALSRTEQWQRAQAWAAWEAGERGENREIGWDAVEAEFERPVRRRRRRA